MDESVGERKSEREELIGIDRREEDGEKQAYRQVGRSRYTRGLFVCSRKVLICEVHGVYTRVCAYELQRVSSSEACKRRYRKLRETRGRGEEKRSSMTKEEMRGGWGEQRANV